MSPQRLKWLVITAPPVVMLMLELAHLWVLPRLKEGTHRIVVDVLVVLGAMLFYGLLCAVSDKNQSRLQRKNDELEALHSASLAIAAELSLEAVLQRVADQARQLIGARYCALAIYGEDRNIEAFLTSGIDEETRKNIGDLPVGKGLLGLTLDRAESLRLHDLGDDPRSVGFPPGHPEMRSLLAVRIPAPAPFRGNLYLSEKLDGGPFTEEDQGIVRRFAIQAAIAVDNARLHRQVAGLATAEERLRLARELHDDRAQILAFVKTEAEVTKEHLRQNRHDLAAEHLDKLSGAAREVYADVREDILSLRSVADPNGDLVGSLRSFVDRWQTQANLPVRLATSGTSRFSAEVHVQLLRVLQEALTNVRKHARATEARVCVDVGDDRLKAVVEDDGVGFDVSAVQGNPSLSFGLATMEERCRSVGAGLTIESGQAGTRVQIEYPVASDV